MSRHILTILAVSDLARSAAFYEAVFGWPRRVNVPVYVEFEQPGGQRFGVYQREAFGLNPGQTPEVGPPGAITGTELYFHSGDLEALLVRLESTGARLLSPLAPRGWGDEAAYYADPDGNVIVAARPLP